jgi:hypothetical protein
MTWDSLGRPLEMGKAMMDPSTAVAGVSLRLEM